MQLFYITALKKTQLFISQLTEDQLPLVKLFLPTGNTHGHCLSNDQKTTCITASATGLYTTAQTHKTLLISTMNF